MACALCHKNRTLRRSHIVPEFMYQAMYDPKHRFQGLSSVPSARARLYQKGLRQELLCEQCEQQFGRYESYATQVFYGGVSVVGQRRGNKLLLSSLDYKRLKLFFLSLLWRFGVTSIDVFRGADLGPHSEKLRKMLLVEDPGDGSRTCLVTAVTCSGAYRRPDRAAVFGKDGRTSSGGLLSRFCVHVFVSATRLLCTSARFSQKMVLSSRSGDYRDRFPLQIRMRDS